MDVRQHCFVNDLVLQKSFLFTLDYIDHGAQMNTVSKECDKENDEVSNRSMSFDSEIRTRFILHSLLLYYLRYLVECVDNILPTTKRHELYFLSSFQIVWIEKWNRFWIVRITHWLSYVFLQSVCFKKFIKMFYQRMDELEISHFGYVFWTHLTKIIKKNFFFIYRFLFRQFKAFSNRFFTRISNTRHWAIFWLDYFIEYHWLSWQKCSFSM